MKNRINFHVEPEIKKRLKKVANKNGLSQAEILRRGLLNQLNDLEGDNHE